MAVDRDQIMKLLSGLTLPGGGDPVSRDMVKALSIEAGEVRFVLEAANAEEAGRLEPLRQAASDLVATLPGVGRVSVVLTAHAPAGQARNQTAKAPPDLGGGRKFGGHMKPQQGSLKPAGVKTIIAVGSGKGGVGKSTLSTNLAVALARTGRRVGLLDADIYGPSQPRMFGLGRADIHEKAGRIIPPEKHGVRVMSLGLMLEEGTAVVWRGPMLMGALQQLMNDVEWGDLDVMIVDLPPGTGDVQLTLAQKGALDGAIMVSTPQDVALIDARKGIDMMRKLKVPILGLVENMSVYCCPKCGHEEHVFGNGGVLKEAEDIGVPVLAQLPIDLETRVGGDEGRPVALGDGVVAQAYAEIAARLIVDGQV